MKHFNFSIMFAAMAIVISAAPQTLFADGDVLAYLEPDEFGFDAHLVIVGDVKDNTICVTVDDTYHAVIDAIDDTTVNGLSTVELSSDLPIVSVSIDLGNGDDSLEYLCESDLVYSATIVLGNGHDSVAVDQQGTMWEIRVDTGVGDDSVALHMGAWSFANWNGVFQISTGVGQDVVIIESADTNPYGRYGSRVDTAEGNDTVMFTGLVAKEFTEVVLGAGDDLLVGDPDIMPDYEYFRADGGLGHDTVLTSSYFSPFSPRRLLSFETID